MTGDGAPLEARSGPSRDPVLWASLVVHCVLGAFGLSERTLWLDEAYSAFASAKPLAELPAALSHDAGPPLYYALLHAWRAAWGSSEPALRVLSLLCAVAATWLLYRLALRTFDRATARAAAALWATHPLAGFYAREARNYTLFALLSLALATALVELATERRAWSGPLLVGSAAASVYVHNLAWFGLAAAFLAAGLAYRGRLPRRWLLAALGGAALAYVPWLPILRRQLQNSEKTIWWMRAYWSPWAPLQELGAFTPFGWRAPLIELPSAGRAWPLLTLAWCIPALVAMWRTGPHRAHARFLAAFVVLGLVLPAAWSAWDRPVIMAGRTDFFLLPFFLLLVAAGLGALGGWARRTSAGVLVAAGLAASVVALGQAPRRYERVWLDVLRDHARPGDVAICTTLTRLGAEYGLEGSGLALLSFPRDMAWELAHYNEAWYREHLDAAAEAEAVVAEARSRLRDGGTLWVVVSTPLSEAVIAEAARRPELAAQSPIGSQRMGLQRIDMPVWIQPYTLRRESAGGAERLVPPDAAPATATGTP